MILDAKPTPVATALTLCYNSQYAITNKNGIIPSMLLTAQPTPSDTALFSDSISAMCI